MPVYSMTGYALQRGTLSALNDRADVALSIELRSINSRYLDISFRLSDALRALEGLLRERLTQVCKRGKIEVRIHLECSNEARVIAPDSLWLQQLQKVQTHILSHMPQAQPLHVADVLRLYTAQASSSTQNASADIDNVALLAQFDSALQTLQHSRAQEGQQLAHGMQERLTRIAALARDAAQHIATATQQQQEKFLQRYQQAWGLTQNAVLQSPAAVVNLASANLHINAEALQERALNEMASFALRVDIAEELDRLHAHVNSLQKLLQQGGEVGKKMEFLIQELHREANTLGSKAPVLALGQTAFELKVLIEQLREQVQNIA